MVAVLTNRPSWKASLLLACFPIFFISGTAESQEMSKFKPVIVTSSQGRIDQNSDRLLIEAFSSALKSGALKTLAREFYGVGGQDFAGSGSKGPIGVLSRFLKQSDTDMANRLSVIFSNIKPPSSDIKASNIELFWTKRTFSPQPSSLQNDSLGIILKMFLADIPASKGFDQNPFALEMTGNLASIQVLREADIPGGKTSLLNESREFLAVLARESTKDWFPVQIQASMSINREKLVTTRISVSMKPVGFQAGSKDAGDFVIESLKYEPSIEASNLVQAVFARNYSPADTKLPSRPAPIVNLNFGPARKESMDADVCIGNDCLQRLDKVPTVYARLDAGWLWNFLAGTLSLHEFRILVNSLAVDIDRMTAVGETSELPLIMRTQTWGWKVVDTKRNTRPLNPIEAIQKSFIGDSVSQGISAELKVAGDNAEKSMNETLKPIIQFLQ